MLLLEARHRTHDPGGARQLARHDPHGVDRRTERATPHLRAQRDEQRVARLGHAAREHHDIGIEDVERTTGDTGGTGNAEA